VTSMPLESKSGRCRGFPAPMSHVAPFSLLSLPRGVPRLPWMPATLNKVGGVLV
jgi:hypothetical protein